MSYIIEQQNRKSLWWVCAPPGKCRTKSGNVIKDLTSAKESGPEWSENYDFAYHFRTHRAAARVANKCNNAKIRKV